MSRYSICFIEDHEVLWSITQQELQVAWYHCDRFTSRTDAIDILLYDCFILDVMLPGYDGFTIWSMIRKKSDAWIIYLTAKVQFTDKETWFWVWADDYLTKPFKVEELLLRIKALITRLPEKVLTLENWTTIDTESREVTYKWKVIHLTPIERRVLWTLVENIWIPCSRVVLIESWWWDDMLFSMSRSLDVTIANLRSKLWKSSITTISKVWYQLA